MCVNEIEYNRIRAELSRAEVVYKWRPSGLANIIVGTVKTTYYSLLCVCVRVCGEVKEAGNDIL